MSATAVPRPLDADIAAAMREIGAAARAAARVIANAPAEQKSRALVSAAKILRQRKAEILAANARDLGEAKGRGLSAAMIDRLTLDEKRIEAMAKGVEEVAKLPDPVGRVLATYKRPNGLVIERVSTPLGVIGVIYESRPNVTADAGALCLKSGNAVVLRGGSDSFSLFRRDPRLPRRGPEPSGPAGSRHFARSLFRPRGCGRNAGGARRNARRHRSPRRQEPGRPRAAGGARSRCSPTSKASSTSMSTPPPISTRR